LGVASPAMSSSPIPILSQVADVTAGDRHTCARKADGTAWCWGLNLSGQLGLGDTVNRTSPAQLTGLGTGTASIAAGGLHACAMESDGSVWCWGANDYGQLGNGTISTSA